MLHHSLLALIHLMASLPLAVSLVKSTPAVGASSFCFFLADSLILVIMSRRAVSSVTSLSQPALAPCCGAAFCAGTAKGFWTACCGAPCWGAACCGAAC